MYVIILKAADFDTDCSSPLTFKKYLKTYSLVYPFRVRTDFVKRHCRPPTTL